LQSIAFSKTADMPYELTVLSQEGLVAKTYLVAEKAWPVNQTDYRKLPDKLLWEAFRSGEELAFITIYKEYCNKLFNYGCQFSPDREMVRDCLQDFFIYLRKNRLGFGSTDCIKFYLFKAFKRRVLDYLKKNSVESNYNMLFAFSQMSFQLSCECININQQTKAEQLEKLNKALKALDHREREAIYYFYYEGLSYEQIAKIFNFTHVSSARRIMYRGLKNLRVFF
jgi:RNA polymerase sigma factor (sigma-70 family)